MEEKSATHGLREGDDFRVLAGSICGIGLTEDLRHLLLGDENNPQLEAASGHDTEGPVLNIVLIWRLVGAGFQMRSLARNVQCCMNRVSFAEPFEWER